MDLVAVTLISGTLRRVVRFLAGNYEAWRIYSIDTPACCMPDVHPDVVIKRIDDLSIFDAPEIDAELCRANCFRPGAIGYAAWRGHALAGVCWLWPGPALQERAIGAQPPNCAELIEIRVARAFRGLGIAPALIMTASCGLRELGYQRLYAQIWPTNTASISSFQKSGWQEVAWFLQVHPRFLPKPLRFRKILSRFKSVPGLLENWRFASHHGANASATI